MKVFNNPTPIKSQASNHTISNNVAIKTYKQARKVKFVGRNHPSQLGRLGAIITSNAQGIAELLKRTPTINSITSPGSLAKRDGYNCSHKNKISKDKVDLKKLKQKSLE